MNSFLFVSYVRFKNLTSKIQAGRYDIPLALTPVQVVELLQHGTFDVRLTFLEGWRREEYLRYALANLAVDDEDFSTQFLVATEDLEGYLFPDTYIVPINIGAQKRPHKEAEYHPGLSSGKVKRREPGGAGNDCRDYDQALEVRMVFRD